MNYLFIITKFILFWEIFNRRCFAKKLTNTLHCNSDGENRFSGGNRDVVGYEGFIPGINGKMSYYFLLNLLELLVGGLVIAINDTSCTDSMSSSFAYWSSRTLREILSSRTKNFSDFLQRDYGLKKRKKQTRFSNLLYILTWKFNWFSKKKKFWFTVWGVVAYYITIIIIFRAATNHPGLIHCTLRPTLDGTGFTIKELDIYISKLIATVIKFCNA